MPVYTRQLGALAVATADTWTLVHTAASSGTTVVRDVLLVNAGVATIPEVGLRIVPGTGTPIIWIGYWKDLAIGNSHSDVRQVIAAGARLEVTSRNAGLFVLVCGYHFDS